MYIKGLGTEINYNKAFEILNEGKDKNDTSCLNALGYMYINGLGVEKDVNLGLKYINKASNRNAEAMYNLGALYLNGTYVKRDWTTAFKYFSQSSIQQYIPGMEQVYLNINI